MTDSGKHSALRQTGDGSFEIVFERDGLQEVSEEHSVAEVVVPEARAPVARPSRRVIGFTAAGVATLLALTAIGWIALSPGDGPAADADSEVSGFRPYVGNEPAADRAPQPTAKDRAAIAAALAEDDDGDVVEAEPVEEITESEPGWELTEAAEPVVVEEPPNEVIVEPIAEVDEEIVEQEGPEEQPVRMFTGRQGVESLRAADIGRNLQAPRVPNLSANPLATKRFSRLPIRGADGGADGEGEVVEGEEVVDEEVIGEEEIVEEEVIEEH